MSRLAAILLAGGLSRRMGQPKMLLPWGDTSVLGQVLASFGGCGLAQIIVVTGGARLAVEAEAQKRGSNLPLACVFNPRHESGEMLSSLQCGLAALDADILAALVGLGDQPQISPQAINTVMAAFEASSADLIAPSHQMRRGHPWLVRRELWGEILAMTPAQTLREFLNYHARDIHYVETDSTVLKDLDTPEEYAREKP